MNENKAGSLFFGIGLIYLLIMTYIGFTKLGVWYDEIFSIGIVQLPLSEIYNLGTKDVHPLLYYFIYKLFLKFFALFNFTDVVLIGKLVSLIPFYLLAVLSITKIRKNFGMLVSGLFMLCICSMPQLMIYGVEIRMYGWGLFFVTSSLIFMWEIIKDSNWKKWLVLTILTICSAYTHYFSAIASFSLYLVFLIYILCKNRKLIKYWILSAVIAILSYIPWLFIVYNQMKTIHGTYWIDPITVNTVIGYIYYILSPAEIFVKANEIINPNILGTLALISIIAVVVYYLKDKKDMGNNFAIYALIIFLIVPVIGIIASSLFSPVFHPRYFIPVLGCLWFSFSVLLSKTYKRKDIFIPILIVILIIGVVGTIDFNNIQQEKLDVTLEKNETLHNNVGSGNVIFYDTFPIYFESSSYYLIDNHHFSNSVNISSYMAQALTDPGIQQEIANGAKVYYFDEGRSNYDDFASENITLEKVASQSSSTMKYTVYEVKI